MAMRKVSIGGVVRIGILATAVLAMLSAPARAQSTDGGREITVSVLGTSNRFSQPMHTVNDLHAMVNMNRNQITQVLTMGGLASISTQVLDTLTTGDVTDTTIAPGSHINWMAIKRVGRPAILRNVRWTGRQSFEAWQFAITANGMTYTFVVPKVCGNLSLVNAVAAPQPRITEAPPPPPPPEPSPAPPTIVVIEPPPAPAPAPAPAPVAPTTVAVTRRPWIASGFVGTSMDLNLPTVGNNTDLNGSVAWGGQIGYMARRYVGVEFLADFAPSVPIVNSFLADEPHVNSYMANVVGAVPLGRDGQFRPYITAGLGAITMHTKVFTSADITNLDTTNKTEARLGSNVGGGLLIFSGFVGVRADVRHYTATAANDADILFQSTAAGDLTKALVSGISFWRTDVGVAFRW